MRKYECKKSYTLSKTGSADLRCIILFERLCIQVRLQLNVIRKKVHYGSNIYLIVCIRKCLNIERKDYYERTVVKIA